MTKKQVYAAQGGVSEVSVHDHYDLNLGYLRALVTECDRLRVPDEARVTAEGLTKATRVDEWNPSRIYVRHTDYIREKDPVLDREALAREMWACYPDTTAERSWDELVALADAGTADYAEVRDGFLRQADAAIARIHRLTMTDGAGRG